MYREDPDPLRFNWLTSQPPEFQAQVMRGTRVIDRKAPEFITHFGDTPTGLYGILDGTVGMHVPGPDGRSVLSHILRQGNWFGQTPRFSDRRSLLSFSVIEDARLLFLPMAKAQEIMDRRPDWTRAFSTVADFGLEIAIAAVGTLQVRNPARRIAATLLRIAPSPQAGRPVQVNITQEDLGEIANVARDVANRALKRFEGEGWISTGYRAVTILRPDLLAKFVEGGG